MSDTTTVTKPATKKKAELPALTEAKLAAVTKQVEKALSSEQAVTVTRLADDKEYTGQLVRREDGTLTVRTGQRGRPVSLTVEQIKKVVRATVPAAA